MFVWQNVFISNVRLLLIILENKLSFDRCIFQGELEDFLGCPLCCPYLALFSCLVSLAAAGKPSKNNALCKCCLWNVHLFLSNIYLIVAFFCRCYNKCPTMYRSIRERCQKDPAEDTEGHEEEEPDKIEIVPDLATEMFYMGDDLGDASIYSDKRKSQKSRKVETTEFKQCDRKAGEESNRAAAEVRKHNPEKPRRKKKMKIKAQLSAGNNSLMDLHSKYCVKAVWRVVNASHHSHLRYWSLELVCLLCDIVLATESE